MEMCRTPNKKAPKAVIIKMMKKFLNILSASVRSKDKPPTNTIKTVYHMGGYSDARHTKDTLPPFILTYRTDAV